MEEALDIDVYNMSTPADCMLSLHDGYDDVIAVASSYGTSMFRVITCTWLFLCFNFILTWHIMGSEQCDHVVSKVPTFCNMCLKVKLVYASKCILLEMRSFRQLSIKMEATNPSLSKCTPTRLVLHPKTSNSSVN